MRTLKIALTLLLPCSAGAGVFGLLSAVSTNFTALYSHDVYESHIHSGLTPLISVVSLFLGVLPCLFYVARLLWSLTPLTEQETSTAKEILTSTTDITIGQVFTSAGANCKLRVKAIKNTVFADANFSNYEYVLQFSF